MIMYDKARSVPTTFLAPTWCNWDLIDNKSNKKEREEWLRIYCDIVIFKLHFSLWSTSSVVDHMDGGDWTRLDSAPVELWCMSPMNNIPWPWLPEASTDKVAAPKCNRLGIFIIWFIVPWITSGHVQWKYLKLCPGKQKLSDVIVDITILCCGFN